MSSPVKAFPSLIVSIARILATVFCFYCTIAHSATDSGSLPPLGNTAEMDRVLLLEISDEYVYAGEANAIPDARQAMMAVQNETNEADANESDVAAVADTKPEEISTKTPTAAVKKTVISEAGENQTDRDWEPWIPVFNDEPEPGDTVWRRISESDRLPLADDERVKFYEEQYLRESLWISKILHRGKPFLAHLVATLDQRFMPVELALLPAIESGYQPTAKSAGNAAGLWQIVPITAKEIGIKRDVWFDGRSDILTSTTAAIDYLSYLSAEFDGDWELTLAAYNAGPGRVRAAIKKNVKAGLPTDYWALELPRETENYVPKLIALIRLLKSPDKGGFDLPDVMMEPAFESIEIGFRVSIDKAAKIAKVDEDLLRSLNAGLLHGVTPPEGPHQLLIPAGSGEQIQMALANVDRNTIFSEPLTHEVRSGDTVSSIALKYGITQRRLMNINGLGNAKIKIGQKLAVINGRSTSESLVEYVVSIGDTLSEIADKFSVRMKDITQANGDPLEDHVIHPGDTLNITLVETPSG